MAKKPLILDEITPSGQLDIFPTELSPSTDSIAAAGINFQDSPNKYINTVGDELKFKDLDTNYENNLEELAFGGGRYFTASTEYVRVPLGHNHVVYQECDVEGEYDILGELVCLE